MAKSGFLLLPCFCLACTFGPQYERDFSPIQLEETGFPDRVSSASDDSQYQIVDPTLQEWLAEVSANNQSLIAAAWRMEAAYASVTQAEAPLYPTLGAEGSASRNRQNLSSFGGLGDVVTPGDEPRNETLALYNSLYAARLASSWQVDLFGRIRKAASAAAAENLAVEVDREALLQTIAARLLQLRSAFYRTGRRVGTLGTVLTNRRQTLATIEGRYRSGISSVNSLAVHQAREVVTTAKADLRRAEQAQFELLEELNVLLGRPPLSEQRAEQKKRIAAYSVPLQLPGIHALPLEHPAEIIDSRPDLRAAELRVLAANERVGVRIADLFPQLTLTGSYGYQANERHDFIRPEQIVWQLAGSLTQSLFSGGSRLAAVTQSEAEVAALQADYLERVLTALREIKVALDRELSLSKERRLRNRSARQLVLAADSARQRYRNGVLAVEEFLESERLAKSAELAALTTEEEYDQNLIDLFVALGGPWIAIVG